VRDSIQDQLGSFKLSPPSLLNFDQYRIPLVLFYISIFSSPKPVAGDPSVAKGDEPDVANDGSTIKESDEVAVDPRHSCGVEESLLKENPAQESTQRFKAVKVTDFVILVPVIDVPLKYPQQFFPTRIRIGRSA
jgi:hypothetical protein